MSRKTLSSLFAPLARQRSLRFERLEHRHLLTGVTLDPGDILVADFDKASSTGSSIKIDPMSGAQSIVSSGNLFKDPAGLAIDANGQIIVSDRNAFGGPGGIISVDVATEYLSAARRSTTPFLVWCCLVQTRTPWITTSANDLSPTVRSAQARRR